MVIEGETVTEAATTDADPQAGTLSRLSSLLGGSELVTTRFRDNLRIFLAPEQLTPALTALKSELGFELIELGCVDYLAYPGRAKGSSRFEVHYVLLNQETHERLILKVGVGESSLTLPSVVALWIGADWMEREIFDMYGISFDGHPDLRRILMPEEFTAHPLRKDYPLRGRGERHNFPRLTRNES
jgi:NADH-quinone oxidoreductase subunit C